MNKCLDEALFREMLLPMFGDKPDDARNLSGNASSLNIFVYSSTKHLTKTSFTLNSLYIK